MRFAPLLWLAAAACTFAPALPAPEAIACLDDDDCPSDARCAANGRCAALDAFLRPPVAVDEIERSTDLLGLGDVLTLRFRTSRPLPNPPEVTARGFALGDEILELAERAPDGEAERYAFRLAVTTPGVEGGAELGIAGSDELGNAFSAFAGNVDIDTRAPAVVDGSVTLVRDPDPALLAPTFQLRGFRAGATGSVLFLVDEPLGQPPVLTADVVRFDPVEENGLLIAASFRVDAAAPEGPSPLRLRLVDVAGNVTELDLASIVVDNTPPAPPPVDVDRAIVITRFPFGGVDDVTACPSPPYVRVAGAIEPDALVRVWERENDLAPLRTVEADGSGAFSVDLCFSRQEQVFLDVVDRGGNLSERAQTVDATLVAALGEDPTAPNPHVLAEGTPSPLDADDVHWRAYAERGEAARLDEQSLSARAGGVTLADHLDVVRPPFDLAWVDGAPEPRLVGIEGPLFGADTVRTVAWIASAPRWSVIDETLANPSRFAPDIGRRGAFALTHADDVLTLSELSGDTWVAVASGLTATSARLAAFDEQRGCYLAAGFTDGEARILESCGGAAWSESVLSLAAASPSELRALAYYPAAGRTVLIHQDPQTDVTRVFPLATDAPSLEPAVATLTLSSIQGAGLQPDGLLAFGREDGARVLRADLTGVDPRSGLLATLHPDLATSARVRNSAVEELDDLGQLRVLYRQPRLSGLTTFGVVAGGAVISENGVFYRLEDGVFSVLLEGEEFHAASFTTTAAHHARSQILFVGGGTFNAPSDAVYLYDHAAGTVTEAPGPPARRAPGLAYDPVGEQVFLFGGRQLNDLWVWDGDQWSELAQQDPRPPARDEPVRLAYHPVEASVWLISESQTWRYDIAGNGWTLLAEGGLGRFVVAFPGGGFVSDWRLFYDEGAAEMVACHQLDVPRCRRFTDGAWRGMGGTIPNGLSLDELGRAVTFSGGRFHEVLGPSVQRPAMRGTFDLSELQRAELQIDHVTARVAARAPFGADDEIRAVARLGALEATQTGRSDLNLEIAPALSGDALPDLTVDLLALGVPTTAERLLLDAVEARVDYRVAP